MSLRDKIKGKHIGICPLCGGKLVKLEMSSVDIYACDSCEFVMEVLKYEGGIQGHSGLQEDL